MKFILLWGLISIVVFTSVIGLTFLINCILEKHWENWV